MASADLSGAIQAALTEALIGAGFDLVSGVKVRRGWGDIDIVTVHAGLAKADASPALPTLINEAVESVLDGRRHYVELRWARSRPRLWSSGKAVK
jgi:hypothetical protein